MQVASVFSTTFVWRRLRRHAIVHILAVEGLIDMSIEGQRHFLSRLRESGEIDLLAESRVLSAAYLTSQSIDVTLLELGLLDERRLIMRAAHFLDLAVVDDVEPLLASETAEQFEEFLTRSGLIVVGEGSKEVTVVTSRPFDMRCIRALGYATGKTVRVVLATPSAIQKKIADRRLEQNAMPEEGFDVLSSEGDDIERIKDAARDAPVVRRLNRLLAEALDRGASDIHFEPLEDRLRIRYRVDGFLQSVDELPKALELPLISRLKILSKLDIAERRLPQDGKMRMAVRGRTVDFRVATSPVRDGESVVLRILDRDAVPLDLHLLGFLKRDRDQLKNLLQSPHGLILVTGPTGSGKSTTLYAMLAEALNSERKIFSIEDPVERKINGISQIQVQPQIGMDFSPALRSVLRQDPDVIMVGEMRDTDTVQTAVRAALTGHLVLSTLHTNSAAATITRLVDMKVDRFLIASCLKAVVAQRLVRKRCTACEPLMGPGRRTADALQLPISSQATAAQACVKCRGSGYSGRTVIYEILPVNSEVQSCISGGADEVEIHRAASGAGITSIVDFAATLIAKGTTTREEGMRVLDMVADG